MELAIAVRPGLEKEVKEALSAKMPDAEIRVGEDTLFFKCMTHEIAVIRQQVNETKGVLRADWVG